MKQEVLLFGAGGHAKGIIEILNKSEKYKITGIIDKTFSENDEEFYGVKIVGNDSSAKQFYEKGLNKAFIGIGTVGEYKIRLNLYNYLKKIGFEFINVVHPKSIISEFCEFGYGNVFFAGSIVNVDVKIGDNCIVNTGSILEHDCIIGNNVHIATGAKLCGGVVVGDNSMVGAGTVVVQQKRIGRNAVVGAGSVVIDDIPDNSIAIGVPAKVIKGR